MLQLLQELQFGRVSIRMQLEEAIEKKVKIRLYAIGGLLWIVFVLMCVIAIPWIFVQEMCRLLMFRD